MINVIAIVVLVAGCAAEPFVPAVNLVHDPAPVPRGWEPLGFVFEDAGLGECGITWYSHGETDCQITIGIVSVPMLRERTGTNARTFRDQRRVEIDSRLEGEPLLFAVSHEVGHVILDTSKHTPTGIMSGGATEMTEDDWRLACESIGRGC